MLNSVQIPVADVSPPRAIQDVLVVDDSRAQRKIASTLLQKWGFTVREAGDASEALALCRAAPPDLVLSDWMMPNMSGPEFASEFRQLSRDSYGYFILLTSKSEKQDIAHGLDAGADDFLTKPINSAELRARIAAGERIVAMERELSEKNRLVHTTLEKLQGMYDSLNSDLIEAKKLQQSLVRENQRDFGAAEVALLLKSCGHVGGDLVGMFEVAPDRIGVYGIDVSGHGVSSALMTARLAGYLSSNAPDQNIAYRPDGDGGYILRSPAETLATLNELILDELETELYFTMLLADVRLDTGRVTFAQAGHPHPALQRKDGQIEFPGVGGLPVGLISGAEYDQTEITLRKGDRLFIHSDGVVEATDSQGNQLSDEGLASILEGLHATKGMAALEALVWDLTKFGGDRDFEDDVSVVLLEFKADGGAA